jgi:ABC-type Fe3+-citrate transport system substrate-binding protein
MKMKQVTHLGFETLLEAADAAFLDAMADMSVNPVEVLDDVDTEVDPMVGVDLEDLNSE